MTLHELQRRLSPFDLRQEVAEVIQKTAPEIVRLNQGQLFLGKRADDTDLAPYSAWYADYKSKLTHPVASITDRRTLYLTGEWWSKIKVVADRQTFTVFNDDAKSPLIERREGPVLGLSPTSKREEYIPNIFFPELKAVIERKLGLKFR